MCGGSVDGVFVQKRRELGSGGVVTLPRVRDRCKSDRRSEGDGYGAVAVAAEETSQGRVGEPTGKDYCFTT